MTKLTWRRIGTDIAGYSCLVGAILFGWLPGPGGIPLLLTGLGLLSIYNPWAKRLLIFVRRHSQSVRGLLFTNKRWVKRSWDLVTILLTAGAILLTLQPNLVLRGMGIFMLCMAGVIFVFNRDRLGWLQKKRRL